MCLNTATCPKLRSTPWRRFIIHIVSIGNCGCGPIIRTATLLLQFGFAINSRQIVVIKWPRSADWQPHFLRRFVIYSTVCRFHRWSTTEITWLSTPSTHVYMYKREKKKTWNEKAKYQSWNARLHTWKSAVCIALMLKVIITWLCRFALTGNMDPKCCAWMDLDMLVIHLTFPMFLIDASKTYTDTHYEYNFGLFEVNFVFHV